MMVFMASDRVSIFSSSATSARRNAYVGVQHRTFALLSRIIRNRATLLSPPPGKQRQLNRSADSNASQKPRNGPKEKANITRSPAPTFAARKISDQLSIIASQLSGVSSQRNGVPLVPLVW